MYRGALCCYFTYPNPTTDSVNINFNKNFLGSIMQTGTMGKEIQQITISDSKEITFQLVGSEGVYFLRS